MFFVDPARRGNNRHRGAALDYRRGGTGGAARPLGGAQESICVPLSRAPEAAHYGMDGRWIAAGSVEPFV